MPNYIYIFILFISIINSIYGQQNDLDHAKNFYEKGVLFEKKSKFDSSFYYLDKAANIFSKSLEDDSTILLYVKSLNKLTSVEYNLGKCDTTLAKTRLETIIKLLDTNHAEVASAYNNHGLVFEKLGDHEKALESYTYAVQLRLKIFGKWNEDVASTYNNLGGVNQTIGNYKKALEYYLLSLEIRTQLFGEKNEKNISSYNNLSSLYQDIGEYDEAMHFILLALEITKEKFGNEHRYLPIFYNNLGTLYRMMGKYDKALSNLLLTLDLLEKLYPEDNPYIATTYSNIGLTYQYKGELEKALEYHMIGLKLRKKLYGEDHYSLSTSYNNIGLVLYDQLEYVRALEYFFKALELTKSTLGDEHESVALIYGNIGGIYDLKNEYMNALKYHFLALEIFIKTLGEDHPKVAFHYSNIASVFKMQGKYEEALKYNYLSNKILQDLFGNHHPQIALNYWNIGMIFALKDDHLNALNYYQKSITSNCLSFKDTIYNSTPKSLDLLNGIYLLKSLVYKCYSLQKLDKEKNRNTIKNTVSYGSQLIDSLRKSMLLQSDQLELGKLSLSIYEIGINSSTNDSAFYYSEKNKSSTLQIALLKTKTLQYSGIPIEIVKTNKDIQNDLTFYSEQLRDEKIVCPKCDSSKIDLWYHKIFNLHRKEDSLEILLNQYAKYKNLTKNSQSVTKTILQRKYLSQFPNTALIEYFWGDSAIYVFAITDKDYIMRTIPYEENFKVNFYGLIKMLSNSNSHFHSTESYAQKAHWAYITLLAPIYDIVKNKNHWIIIPDGDLYKLPFGALLTSIPNVYNKDYSNLSYLAKEKAISYHFSATLLMQEVERKRKKTPKDFIGFAPVFKSNSTEPMLTTRNVQLASIPGTEYEIKGIYELFNQVNPKKSKMYLHEEATERAFKTADLENYKTVMVSTHGFTDDERPEFSGIAFYPDSTDNEDDILYSGEMYNLQLNAELVILAGCETGRGERKRGEGLMGLTRGLFYSGAKRVMSSLWKVSDASTAKLNLEFQKYLLDGYSYPKALQMARLSLIQNPMTAHPYYWSAFVLLGE